MTITASMTISGPAVVAPPGGLAATLPAPRLAEVADLPVVEAHMRTMLERELGGYDPRLHTDVDDLGGAYLDTPGRALLLLEIDGVLAGTATVRPGGPRPEFVPAWLAHRYAGRRVGQICRVWVDPAHRRRGVGQALSRAAVAWAVADGYDPICLHTDASVPGALAFWRAFPGAVEVHDSRPDPWSTVHFEIRR